MTTHASAEESLPLGRVLIKFGSLRGTALEGAGWTFQRFVPYIGT